MSFRAGETILRQGEHGDTAFLLQSGTVKVLVGSADPRWVATLDPGEVFGEMSLLEPGPRSASVVAITNVECVETTYDEFMGSMRDHPDQAVIFMQTLVRRLRQSNEMLARLDPRRRGLRGILAELQQAMSLDSASFKDEAAIAPYFTW